MKDTRILLTILAMAVVVGFTSSRTQAAVLITTEQINAVNVTFTTIPNISAIDLTEFATFTAVGTPHGASGGIGVLHDGVFPADGAAGSAFFSDTVDLSITVDLGSAQSISQINTYSSDTAFSVNRAPQRYTVLGSTDGLTFTTIAIVLNNGGGAQFSMPTGSSWGNSISDSTGSLGTYQYLRFDTVRLGGEIGMFLNEIDVFGVPEPSSVMLLALGGALVWRRRKHAA